MKKLFMDKNGHVIWRQDMFIANIGSYEENKKRGKVNPLIMPLTDALFNKGFTVLNWQHMHVAPEYNESWLTKILKTQAFHEQKIVGSTVPFVLLGLSLEEVKNLSSVLDHLFKQRKLAHGWRLDGSLNPQFNDFTWVLKPCIGRSSFTRKNCDVIQKEIVFLSDYFNSSQSLV